MQAVIFVDFYFAAIVWVYSENMCDVKEMVASFPGPQLHEGVDKRYIGSKCTVEPNSPGVDTLESLLYREVSSFQGYIYISIFWT